MEERGGRRYCVRQREKGNVLLRGKIELLEEEEEQEVGALGIRSEEGNSR